MKNVLIVSYTFPPTGGAGVQRISKLVKYLPLFGWNSIVLTPSNPSVPIKDDSLLKDISCDTKIYRSRTFEPSYGAKRFLSSTNESSPMCRVKGVFKSIIQNILLPDPQVLWWPCLSFSIISTIIREKVDCIFVTSPPFSALIPPVLIGYILNIPVVVDFRDEWKFIRINTEHTTKNNFACRVDNALESLAIRLCRNFTAATQGYVDSIHSRYIFSRSKGEVLTNGYDDEDFIKRGAVGHNDEITISYIGSVWNETSLRAFISVYAQITAEKSTPPMRLKIIGRIVDSECHYLRRATKSCTIEISGYQPHCVATVEMANADILLLTLSNSIGSERIIPGKTFEYMASGKHIFAIIPRGETYRLLEKHYPNATFADPQDTVDIHAKFRHIIESISSIRAATVPNVEQFSRANLAKSLANLLNKCIESEANV